MNLEVIKRINHLISEKASWKVSKIDAKKEDDKEEMEAIDKKIAIIDDKISKLAPYISDEDYVLEEDKESEEEE